ncbi:LLM class flavin-dependent oxidoreductase [Bradyrhizobium sp. UFLA05-112]
MTRRQVHLGAFLTASGFHTAAWRHKGVPAGGGLDPQLYKRVAQAAERGKLDALFVPDFFTVNLPQLAIRQEVVRFEPMTLLSYLAAAKDRIGLVGTSSTTYDEVYHTARRFASLDHLSGGRAGWNVVTSAQPSGPLFGRGPLPEHDLRYEMADEFFRAVCAFWDSWEDGAITRDKANGVFFDREKLHPVSFRGERLSLDGILDVARPVQGYPVIAQAGASEAGKAFGAKYAELVFVTGQPDVAKAQAFYADVKRRAEAFGRNRNSIKILPAIHPVVGRTMREAEEKFEYLQSLVHPEIGLESLRKLTGGFDFTAFDLDDPVPEVPLTNGNQTCQKALFDIARDKGMTIRELYLELAGGMNRVIGTPADIADFIERWSDADAADGFMISILSLPDSMDDFVDLVIPELQERGLFRREYQGTTLRDHLGLARPPRLHYS